MRPNAEDNFEHPGEPDGHHAASKERAKEARIEGSGATAKPMNTVQDTEDWLGSISKGETYGES